MGRHSAPKKLNFFAVALPIFLAVLIFSAGIAVVQLGPIFNPPNAVPEQIMPGEALPTDIPRVDVEPASQNSGSSNFPNESTASTPTSLQPLVQPTATQPVPKPTVPASIPPKTTSKAAISVSIPLPVVKNLEAIAECESGSNWSINTGNSYFGGLQFSQATWVALGGLKFGLRADLATKDEQLQIAAKLQAQSGYKSWPSCSAQLNLG